MGKLYSVEAMISEDGKIYKGTLDFYDTKCILHSDTRLITEFFYDIRTAEFISGVTSVTFLNLYSKEKNYLIIKTTQGCSVKFIIDDEKINETIETLKNFGNMPAPSYKFNKSSYSKKEKTVEIKDYDENVLTFFLSNPYCILGIASNTSIADANDVLEKIKRLDRLNVIGSYKTEFKLAGFKPVYRDIAACQNAIASLKDLNNKWFWFDSEEACQRWQFESYRIQIESNNIKDSSYDLFLAQYLFLLTFDKQFERRSDWYDLLAFYQYVVGENHVEMLKDKLSKNEVESITDDAIINSFADHVFDPLDVALENAGLEAMLGFFRAIRMDRFGALKTYKRNLAGKIAQWFINKEKTLWEKIEEYIGVGSLSEDEAYNVWMAAQEYDRTVQLGIGNALTALTKEPLRADMVKASYCKVMEKIMILLLAGNNKIEALKYGKYLYRYADDDLKIKILATFGVEAFPEAIAELPKLMEKIPNNGE